MWRYNKVICLMLAVIVFYGIQEANAANKISVEVAATADDTIGQRLVYQIREQIRRSSGLKLTTNDEPRLSVNIVTIDPYQNEPKRRNINTVYSINIMVSGTRTANRHLNNLVGILGGDRVNEVAERMVAKLDSLDTDVSFSKDLSSLNEEIQQDRLSDIFSKAIEIGKLKSEIETLKTELAKEKAKTGWQKLMGK